MNPIKRILIKKICLSMITAQEYMIKAIKC